MLKNFLLASIVGVIICAGMKVEAAEIYVGMSPVTGYECYVMTDTISRTYEHRMVITSATLKMVDQYGDAEFLEYVFFALDGGTENVTFTNSQGFKGRATPQDTPIEWAMYTVIRDY